MKSVIEKYQKAKDGDNQLLSPDKEVKVKYYILIINYKLNSNVTYKQPNN